MAYVELHARSSFSFLRAGSTPEKLIAEAARLELGQVALCDRDGFYGSVRHHMKGLELKVGAIIGAELTMEDKTVVPVLVATPQGYQGLSRLITTAKLRAPKGESRVRWDELADASAGLFALTGDEEGPVITGWQRSGTAGAEAGFNRLHHIFGGRLHVEIQRHHVRGETRINGLLQNLAAANGAPLLATNGVLHATPENRAALDAFTCIRHHTHLDVAGPLLSYNGERHLKDAKSMAELFADLPGAVLNTERLAGQLGFRMKDLGYKFPTFPVPAGETMDSHLRARAFAGALERYTVLTPKIKDQLERELTLIAKLKFSGYFLIVWDICEFCRNNDILVQGRGSAANSVVCYALKITAVDPIACKLLFERFLNEGQTSWPDIDLDLPSGDRREATIQEIYKRYAPRGAAMTANVITYRGRSTVRELGKVLNLPENITEGFSSLYANGDFPETLPLKEQLRLAGLSESHARLPALLSLYHQILRQPRHLGQHSGGMIICRGQLDAVVPLENASMPGRVVAQWDKDDCDDLGIVKVDFLGLGMMAALQDSLKMCEERGHPVDLARIPLDDKKTFELLCAADTIGVFQVESRAQMATLPRLKPKEFYDVAIQVAIIRPGPIHGNAVNPYLQCRADPRKIVYHDERLIPILERTLGVTLFQEQILQIAMVLGKFTGKEASDLRRAIDFKRSPDRLEKMLENLRIAMAENRVSLEASAFVLKSVVTFALYGFPESHALSFALIAYASSYLKVHRPAEFYAGLINNQPMGFYSVATLIQDARRRGLRIRPACCVASDWLTTVEADDAIRIGLHRIKGLRETAGRAIVAARAEQPFDSMHDFLRRAQLDPQIRRTLAEAGALNALAGHRRAALWQVEDAPSPDDLFSACAPGGPELSPLEAMTHLERIAADYRTTSLTVGDHPMKAIRATLPGMLRAADLAEAINGSFVTIAGSVICRQRPGTAHGFVFISLEDETGVANAIVRPDLFERLRLVITQESALAITGKLQSHQGVIHIKAEQIRALARAELPVEASHDFH
jgi:error-prone DNA polymerase